MYLEIDVKKRKNILNDDYNKDVNFEAYYTRIFLWILGIWPMVKKASENWKIIISKLLILLATSLLMFIIVPCLVHMISREKDIKAKLTFAGPISFSIANILKYSSMIYHRAVIADCVEHMRIDWTMIGNNEHSIIMMRNVRVGRNLTVMCCLFLYPCIIGYNLVIPLLTGEITDDNNVTARTLPLPGYDIFLDVTSSPSYEFILYSCFMGSLVSSTIMITSCNLAATFVAHACGQFEILVSRLETLVDNDNNVDKNKALQEKTRIAVSSHIRVLRFSSKIEEVLREICCIEVLASTLIICLDEYYCLMEWKNGDTAATLTYIGGLVSLSLNIFIFCHIGEMLKEQCDRIEKAAYTSDWYELDGKTGLAIVMIINMRNNPCKLTACGMMDLSNASFGSIMKTTLAYLNMLRAVGF